MALADGAGIATWKDDSGKGNDATQTTAASQPLFYDKIANNKPVVRFNGASGQSLNLAGVDGLATWTAFAVFRPVPGNYLPLLCGTAAGGPMINFSNNNNFYVYRGGGNYPALSFYSSLLMDGNFHVVTCDATPQAFNNGAIMPNSGSNGISAGSTIFNIIGYQPGQFSGTFGDIAELLFYNRILTAAEKQQVEAYLYTKYAITPTEPPGTVPGMRAWFKADAITSSGLLRAARDRAHLDDREENP
jgi:hypothetical protein